MLVLRMDEIAQDEICWCPGLDMFVPRIRYVDVLDKIC